MSHTSPPTQRYTEPETYEAIRHYSSLCANLRLLLLTQAYIWLSAIAYFPLKVLDTHTKAIVILAAWLIAVLATFSTALLDLIHSNYLGFMMVLLERAKTQIEKGDGPWSTIHGRRQGLRKWRILLLTHPGVSMIGLFFLAALGVTLLVGTTR